jgi:HD-GYP domain-containing protein (c-di-GMP phosphodiesterase class II)
VLTGVAALAERHSLAVGERIQTSVSFLPLLFAAVAFGPLTAFVVAGLAAATDIRRPYLRCAVYTPARALTGAAAGLAAAPLYSSDGRFGALLAAALAAATANVAVDALLNSLTLAVRRSGNALTFARTMFPFYAVALPLYVPLVALFVYTYQEYALWVSMIGLLPALALQRLIRLYQRQREALDGLAASNARLEEANLSFAAALVATLDARDPHTAGHSAAVAIYARDIAAYMGLSPDEQQRAAVSGLVHDIGKIGLAPGLLEKPGALTVDERHHMESHSVIGERILANVEDYAPIAAVVRHHHERIDGTGYPDGIAGDDIPLLSRIVAVADAYNAMTSDRPYRHGMSPRVARLRLAQAANTQLDPVAVAAFDAILGKATEAYKNGNRADFRLQGQPPSVDAREPHWPKPPRPVVLVSAGDPREELPRLHSQAFLSASGGR